MQPLEYIGRIYGLESLQIEPQYSLNRCNMRVLLNDGKRQVVSPIRVNATQSLESVYCFIHCLAQGLRLIRIVLKMAISLACC